MAISAGCASDGGSGSGAAAGADAGGASGAAAVSAPWQLRALSYNTALAPGFEAYSSERLPKILSALSDASKQLDLMCVQEFWQESSFAGLVAATNDTLPHTVHPSPKPGSGVCSDVELGTLGACVQAHCAPPPDGDSVGCIQSKCTSEVQSLSGGCLGCLLNNLDNFGACASAGGAAVASDPAIFGGNYDIGLLSRFPITKQEVLPLDAYFQRGSVLYAQVEVPNLGPVHAFCTHFSSSLGVIPYAGPDGSWDGEHTRETEQLLDFVQDKASDDAPVLVMGDLNMGLALNGSGAVSAEDFKLLLATGLRDPYLDAGNPSCSECKDNSFRAADSTDDLIDHLLIKGFPAASVGVTRELRSRVSVMSGDATRDTNLSDHYGLELTVTSR